jgi:hypothetical protein
MGVDAQHNMMGRVKSRGWYTGMKLRVLRCRLRNTVSELDIV